MAARRLAVTIVVALAALAGVLLSSAAAFAAAPEAPEATVVSPVPATTATVNGVLDPGVEGGPGTYELGTYEFLYKVSSAAKPECEGEGKAPASPGISLGGGKEQVSQVLSGLAPGTEYAVCLLARNGTKGEHTVSPPIVFKTAILPEAPLTEAPELVGATTATLKGVLNPGNVGERGSYEFIYKQSSDECEITENERNEGASQSATSAESSLGKEREKVSVPVSGLLPSAQYTFCLRAVNGAGESVLGSPRTFATFAEKPSVSGEAVSTLGVVSATVSAQIDTGGLEGSYRLQYGTGGAYGLETSAVNVSAGVQTVIVPLTGLRSGTEYHFRFLVTNSEGRESGSGLTFTTYPEVAQRLPDRRVYELVSSLDTPDSELYEMNRGPFQDERPYQAADNGEALAYVGLLPSTKGGDGSANEYRAVRGPRGGWTQADITPPLQRLLYTNEDFYEGFSSDLSVGFFNAITQTPLQDTVSPPEGEGSNKLYALYLRSFSDGLFEPVFTTAPLYTRCCGLHEGVEQYGGVFDTSVAERTERGIVVAGASADVGEVLFGANDALLEGHGALESELDADVAEETKHSNEAGAIEAEANSLEEEELKLPVGTHARYEKREEASLKRREAGALETAYGTEDNRNELYASSRGELSLVNVSPEGKVVPGATFGGEAAGSGSEEYSHVISADGSRIFWQSLGTMPGVYVRVDGSRTERVSEGSGQYWTASDDGRYAYYTEAGKLWRFDVESEARSEIAGAGGGVLGVIGTNEAGDEGAYVYFVSTEALGGTNASGAEAKVGAYNLYVAESSPETGGQRLVFIASLSSADAGDWAVGIGTRTAELAPDGKGLVFVANENLLGHSYPNESAGQVYVFEAADGSLSCASCGVNTSGGRLVGSGSENRLYQYRWISEDGSRVFFESEAPLVYNDTNGQDDVYEWERDGSGECAQADGCIYLLSAGGVEGPAFFVDASVTGDDVFIETRQHLVSDANSEALEIYDARVNGVRTAQPPACSGTGCQGAPSPPLPFSTPASVTFAGVGNFPPAPVTVKKSVTKKIAKCVIVKKRGKTRMCKRRSAKKTKKANLKRRK